MGAMSYLSVVERYHEYREALREILSSMLTGIAEARLIGNANDLAETMRCVHQHYPFVDLLYTLDADGIQNSPNVAARSNHLGQGKGQGKDRSQRPYYRLARETDEVVMTEPYLSNAGGLLCISAAVRLRINGQDGAQNPYGYVILDIDLTRAVEFLMGDTTRRRFVPAFKWVYTLIVTGLFGVVGLLLYAAMSEITSLYDASDESNALHTKPFGVIIFLTLALAIFDLGKTILEEEVLMHKDIFRHSSTRRTITRFMAAILIAVSIEALLLMFKSALGTGVHGAQGGWMMLAAVGLLIGLGVYVYLGAKAEAILLESRRAGSMWSERRAKSV